MAFKYTKLAIPDVVRIQGDAFADERGFFSEIFKSSDFAKHGIIGNFQQFNYSKSNRNVLRGMHYQLKPYAQAKLVTVMAGVIYDVVVDIRRNSSTFGQWVSTNLSAADHSSVYVPSGFAHGFVAMSEVADVIYYCSSEYSPPAERGIVWNDIQLAIKWPIDQPILSDKDAAYPTFKVAEINF